MRAFTQQYSHIYKKIQNIFIFFYDRDFKDVIEKITIESWNIKPAFLKSNTILDLYLKTEELLYYHSSLNKV